MRATIKLEHVQMDFLDELIANAKEAKEINMDLPIHNYNILKCKCCNGLNAYDKKYFIDLKCCLICDYCNQEIER